jgi:hypothetical protein
MKVEEAKAEPIVVVALKDDNVSVMISSLTFLRKQGIDPLVWSPILALLIKSISQNHAESLLNDAGEHPEARDVLGRILEGVPDHLEEMMGVKISISTEDTGPEQEEDEEES